MRRLFFVVTLLFALALSLSLCGSSHLGDTGSPLFNGGNGTLNGFGLDTSGAISVNRPGTPTACWDFESAVGGTYADDCDGSYAPTVNGTPEKGVDGTWPAGISGSQGNSWSWDGSTDSLTLADGSGGDDFDGTNGFSVQCAAMTNTTDATTDVLMSKGDTGANLGWVIYRFSSTLSFRIYKTAGSGTTIGKTISTALPFFVTVTYEYVADGTSEMRMYINNDATATSSVAEGPVNDNALAFGIGAFGTPGNQWSGWISHCALYMDTVITEAQHDFAYAQWQGRVSSSGPVIAVTSASPPAIIRAPADSGMEPFLQAPGANSGVVGSVVTGSGGYYGARQTSNLCFRRSLETWAAGSPTGWTETSGGGTSDAVQNTSTWAHGASSAQMVCDGSNTISLDSGCTALAASTDYYVQAYQKTSAGTADYYLQLIECTDGACSVGCVTTTLYNGDPGSDWVRQGGTRTTGGSAASGQVRLHLATNSATIVVDAVSLFTGTEPIDHFCPGDTDAAATCNHMVSQVPSMAQGNGSIYYEGTYRSAWSGVGLTAAKYLFGDGTVWGNNTHHLYVGTGTDEVINFDIDGAGGQRSVQPNVLNWSADTDYTVKWYRDGAGGQGVYWNSAWNTTQTGAGTAILSADQANAYLAGVSSEGCDCWLRGFSSSRRIR
jgi:hypothetical protein